MFGIRIGWSNLSGKNVCARCGRTVPTVYHTSLFSKSFCGRCMREMGYK